MKIYFLCKQASIKCNHSLCIVKNNKYEWKSFSKNTIVNNKYTLIKDNFLFGKKAESGL
jgi:hypothetical protein